MQVTKLLNDWFNKNSDLEFSDESESTEKTIEPPTDLPEELKKLINMDKINQFNSNNGNLPMHWLQKIKTSPPEWMYFKGCEKSKNKYNQYLFQVYSKILKIEPPQWMYFDVKIKIVFSNWFYVFKRLPPQEYLDKINLNSQQKNDLNLLQSFIVNAKIPTIPDYLLCDNINKNGLAWDYLVNVRQPFPEWMRYEGMQNETNKNKISIYLLWIKYIKTEPPGYLKYDGFEKQITTLGLSAISYWIKYIKTEPPEYLKYDGFEKQIDIWGNSLAMCWLQYIQTPFPNWLKYDYMEYQINDQGYNLAMLWIKYIKTPFPKELCYENIEKQKIWKKRLVYDKFVGYNIISLWNFVIKTKYPYIQYLEYKQKEGQCCICWDENVKFLNSQCSHLVCEECIQKMNNYYCPICCQSLLDQEVKSSCVQQMMDEDSDQ